MEVVRFIALCGTTGARKTIKLCRRAGMLLIR